VLQDNMASLIQKIARQAALTFSFGSSTVGENKIYVQNFTKLKSLLTEIRAEDLNLTPRKSDPSVPISVPQNPPVTYMHICETASFSMGIFLLKSGTSIPLHDHPGMNGMLKVLYGKVKISCFDKLDKPFDASIDQFSPTLLSFQKEALKRSIFRSVGEYTEASSPCILSPQKDNLHQIIAVDGPAAFMDILAPPYDSDDGRDCHYYKVVHPACEREEDNLQHLVQQEVWLLEIPPPANFWCGGEPYPGPEVTL
uniref:2-aminoethanethiol dioxygenase n=2 Tax=Latimeria chalumnae TaxID=7897 RepID=H3B1P6_LATCH